MGTDASPLMKHIVAAMQKDILSDPQFAKHSHLATMMARETKGSAIQEKFVQTMICYKFKLLISYGDFITSDNPGWFISSNNSLHNIKFDKDFHYLIPITPRHCLSISYNNLDNEYIKNPSQKRIYATYVDAETITTLNRLSIDHFTNYLFASNKLTAERIADLVKLRPVAPKQ